jgi:hypothetical protein
MVLDFRPHDGCDKMMQREYAIQQIARREGYRLEKAGDDGYRLINARLNIVVYHLDGVPLDAIASFLEMPESRQNASGARHR